MTAWQYLPWQRTYDTPQAVVDDGKKFDEMPEGCTFCLHKVGTDRPVWFKVERGKAVQLPQ